MSSFAKMLLLLLLAACGPRITYSSVSIFPAEGSLDQRRVDYWTLVKRIQENPDGSYVLYRENDTVTIPAGYRLQVRRSR